MHFISPELEDYIEQHSEKEPALLAALNKETYRENIITTHAKWPFSR